MAPSTASPTDLHRASVACLQCRKAKVRCLVSQRLDRCNRCIANDTGCVFTQPKRARARPQKYPQRPGHSTSEDAHQSVAESSADAAGLLGQSPQDANAVPVNIAQPTTATTPDNEPQRPENSAPIITDTIRVRIIGALASLRGRRGAPFSFVTSGDNPSFNSGAVSHPPDPQRQQAPPTPTSLRLSSLLRPLGVEARRQSTNDNGQNACPVKMPSYLSAMTLGHTITDPIDGGMLSLQASESLFEFFMLQLNAKWEYILDPVGDSHPNVRQRSPLLFATILFCASKFANCIDGHVVPQPDAFLQTRLCSLARNLVVRMVAQGNRSIETMQALYLLVCWKDADDDVSYIHSGYAFRILQDLDMDPNAVNGREMARRRRTWLALFRQDKQQSLFFMRREFLSQADEDTSFLSSTNPWVQGLDPLPLDLISCCSADLRRTQSKLRSLVQRASAMMLPCLLDLMDTELSAWKSKWKPHITDERTRQPDHGQSLHPAIWHPGRDHLDTIVQVWEHSVKLNVASAILRQALMISMSSSLESNRQPADSLLDLDLSKLQRVLSPDLPGLTSSVEGAFGTLRHLLRFPPEDLRRSPDAILLLAPNAALFLCLLLCLPENGILGSSFQRTAVTLIRNIAHHVAESVQSPQDTAALHSIYLDSLVELLQAPRMQNPGVQHSDGALASFELPQMHFDANALDSQQSQGLADGIGFREPNMTVLHENEMNGLLRDPPQNIHGQSLANLLEGDLFWDMPSAADDMV
ncbi:hypothetical protein BDW62DRAFT_206840 [Aspergillus aurantiobrunneus]